MEIVASCSYEESLKYNGKLSIETEEGKSDKISLNIVVSDGNLDIINAIKTPVKCITYVSDVDFGDVDIPEGRVFREYEWGSKDTLSDSISYIPDRVTPILRVPDDYSDMYELKKICTANPRVRIIGGNLLNIEGIRIGRYDIGKDKGSPVYNGVYDTFLEVQLSDLNSDNLKQTVRKVRKKLDVEGSTKTAKKSITPKKSLSKAFSSLFGGIEEEEF